MPRTFDPVRLLALSVALVATLPTVAAARFCVVPGDHATLQAALDDAGCNPIDLSVPTYEGAFVITRDVELRGRGATRTALVGTVNGRPTGASVVTVERGANVRLRDLTLRDGVAPHGGGLLNDGGRVTLTRCTVMNNHATDPRGEGGGLLNRGTGALFLFESEVRRNTARLNGGGIASSGISVRVPFVLEPQAILDNLQAAYQALRDLDPPDLALKLTTESVDAFIEAIERIGDEVGAAFSAVIGDRDSGSFAS